MASIPTPRRPIRTCTGETPHLSDGSRDESRHGSVARGPRPHRHVGFWEGGREKLEKPPRSGELCPTAALPQDSSRPLKRIFSNLPLIRGSFVIYFLEATRSSPAIGGPLDAFQKTPNP